MLTIDDLIERFDGSLAYSTNSKEMCQYIADLLRELVERRKAPEIIRCGECANFKDNGSTVGYCKRKMMYQYTDYFCGDAEKKHVENG